MATYKKQVVWNNPFNDQFMAIGNYGMSYTRIVLDVPLLNQTREIWEFSETFQGVQLNPTSPEDVTFYPSIPYEAGTLKAFADGEEIPVQEFLDRKSFDVRLSDVQGRYLTIEYVPQGPQNFLGDSTQNLREIYGLEASVYYSTRLRNTVELARTYTNRMLNFLNIRPYLWIGGPSNTELGSVQPKITDTNAKLHLETLVNATTELSNNIVTLGYPYIDAYINSPQFNPAFMEELQKIITQCDAGVAYLSENSII